ncbi:DNA (cytosine-5-)-methyltransferase [Wujia sp.]|uniref:DNA (cytosine-5-)-methyltransferase n=1 Tax=Wujia sp. TaxID=2944172 RepID=UPI00206A7EFF|nr:MAG TPA: Cytosine specific methyltransferase [Caudoviricetes sp.]
MARKLKAIESKALPKGGNSILNNAKYSSANTDEWYTTYETIAEELLHYREQFRNKVVLCNCDDPYESNFCYYFLKHFNQLQLKKLICTSYVGTKITQIQANSKLSVNKKNVKGKNKYSKNGYVLIVTEMPGKNGEEVSDEIIKTVIEKEGTINKLNGSGDFSSDECIEYLKECDICCTNPPFSLFASLFSLLIKYEKQYLLIGNQNAITYKEIFPYIKENKAWVGYRFGDMSFRVPDDTEPRNTRFWVDESGQKWRSLGNAMWLTNLDMPKRHQELILTAHYESEKYPKYDDFDGINVQKVADIPMDYFGIMGVPITYLKYHNGEQFEIVGEANHGSDNEFDLFKPRVNGKELFKRILIRRIEKKPSDFKMLDLFCGAGGLSWGMDKNPYFKTMVALDFDEHAANTFKKNMPYAEVVVGDITEAKIKERVVALSQKAGVNMIVGGPPCQGYSMKGKKLGLQDPRNFLFREYLDLVQRLQPDVFVIENVKGLLLSANGWFKDQIVSTIENLGYTVRFGILNAENFGVPQSRERAIFICSKHGAIELPEATVKSKVTVRDAIEDLAYLESNEGDFQQEYITEPKSDYQIMMRAGSKKLYNHKASNHKQIAIDKLKMIPPEQGKEFLPEELHGKQKFKTTWGRLKWDEVSPTIDTRFDASSNGTNNHPFLHRAITPREAARLQSFDDNFIFYGSKVHVRKQVGNAVPPLLAKAIADKIAKTFELGE